MKQERVEINTRVRRQAIYSLLSLALNALVFHPNVLRQLWLYVLYDSGTLPSE